MPPSFQRIHYGLRPAKNVERKLIIECLRALQPEFQISDYRYVGLGSIFFTDFVLVHRLLGIGDMLSIEKEPRDAKRAAFNVPYKCIKVIPGETTEVLPTINLTKRPTILWLDYDSNLRGPVLEDLEIVAQGIEAGSVFAITMNAVANQLHEKEFPPLNGTRDRKVVLSELTGRPLETIMRDATDRNGFPPFLADFLCDRFDSLVRDASGNARWFSPLFNFSYSDGAAMVTIGGMVVDALTEERMRTVELPPFATGRDQLQVSIPLLTAREKLQLDRMFPCDPWPTAEDVENEIGLPLNDDDLRGYWRFYRHYPAFGEIVA